MCPVCETWMLLLNTKQSASPPPLPSTRRSISYSIRAARNACWDSVIFVELNIQFKNDTNEVHKFVSQKFVCYSAAATCFGLDRLQGHHSTVYWFFWRRSTESKRGRFWVILCLCSRDSSTFFFFFFFLGPVSLCTAAVGILCSPNISFSTAAIALRHVWRGKGPLLRLC